MRIVLITGTLRSGTTLVCSLLNKLPEVVALHEPMKFWILSVPSGDQAASKNLTEKNEAIAAMSLIDGKPAAYVCENFTCKAPVTDPKALRELLR